MPMNDRLVKLVCITALDKFGQGFIAGFEVGSDFLVPHPILITSGMPSGDIVDGDLVYAVWPTVALLVESGDNACVLRAVIEHLVHEFTKIFREAILPVLRFICRGGR